jgi:hypothetical protein
MLTNQLDTNNLLQLHIKQITALRSTICAKYNTIVNKLRTTSIQKAIHNRNSNYHKDKKVIINSITE